MIRIFKTTDSGIRKVAVAEEGCWIALTNPTAEELSTTADQFNIDVDDLKSPLDEEERSRIQVEENYTLIILDIPTIEERKGREYFYTIPFGIIFTDKYIFTVCLVDSPVLTVFMDGRVKDFYTYKRTRFIYQMLYRNATMFLQYLKIIDKKSDEVEKKLHISQRNQELIEMLDLEKSLVYFTTSLRGNEVVLEKLMRNTSIPRYEDDEELLEDVIIENKQAIEMANIYSGILSGTMDAFASVISNNLNIVMKFLASVTIVMSIPTMIASFYGMNVLDLPLPYTWFPVLISVILAVIVAILITKNKFYK